jgi:hypothetical protein
VSTQIVVGGYWLSTLGGWGELSWSSTADGGCAEASWKMSLPLTYSHPALRRNRVVEVKDGPTNVWKGILTEPDVNDDWTFTAQGLSTLAAHFLCFDGSLNTSTTPDVAIDRAIADGLPWTRPVSLSNVAYVTGGTTNSLMTLKDLLDAWATSAGKRWGVNAQGEVYAVADPTVPTWVLTPGAGRFGLADDEYASHLFVRYLATGAVYTTATASDTTAATNFGRREYPVDATGRGIITGTQATAIGTGLLAKGKARQGYTNGVTPSRWQLTTPGGTPASLWQVQAGQLVRQFGVQNEQGQPTNYIDWVIGEAKYEAGAETIGLTPVGLVARSFTDVIADLGGA